MEKEELSRIWTIVGVLVLYLTINIWSKTQGWGVNLPNVLSIEKTSYTASVYGIILCAPLLIWLLLLSRSYALRFGGDTWSERIPPVFVKLTSSSKESRRVRGAMFFLILFLPSFGQGHFFSKFLAGTAYCQDKKSGQEYCKLSGNIVGAAHLARFASIQEGESGFFRYGDTNRDNAVDYYPFWGPWSFLIMELVILYLFISASFAIFLGKGVRIVPFIKSLFK
jgi:hypothetical protein